MKQGFTLDPSAPQDFLFVGPPGSGKTSFALAGFPGVYILDVDNNLRPAVSFTGKSDFFYDIANLDDDGKLIDPPNRYAETVKRLNAAAANPAVKTIVIDSLTTFAAIIISEVKRQNGLKDDSTMRIQDWGDFAYLLRTLVVNLKASGKHVIWIGHNLVDKDEADQSYKHFIMCPGQTKDIIAGFFSNVWEFFFDIKGVGATATQELKIRTIPRSRNDFRGLKGSFKNIQKECTADAMLKFIKDLVQ